MEGNNRRHCASVINPNNLVTERLATSQHFLLVLLLPFKTYPLKSHYRVPRNAKLAVSTPARPLLPIQPTLFYLAPMADTLEKLSSNPPRHITKEEAALTKSGDIDALQKYRASLGTRERDEIIPLALELLAV